MNFLQLLASERRKAKAQREKDCSSLRTDGRDGQGEKDDEEILHQQKAEWPYSIMQFDGLHLEKNRRLSSIEQYRVGHLPTLYYIRNWISPEQEAAILSQIYAVPHDSNRWTVLKTRRLQNWGGKVLSSGLQDQEDLPPYLEELSSHLVACGVFDARHKPNHVLINEYQIGQGIMPHTDGPAYYPRTATISLGSDALMYFYPRILTEQIGQVENKPVAGLLLEQGSLVVFCDSAYSSHLHTIPNVEVDVVGQFDCAICNIEQTKYKEGNLLHRQQRLALTIRHALGTPSDANTQAKEAKAG